MSKIHRSITEKYIDHLKKNEKNVDKIRCRNCPISLIRSKSFWCCTRCRKCANH